MSDMTNNNVLWRFRNGREDLGPFGERLWSKVILGCGLFYVKFADLPCVNGKGPRLTGSDLVLPDFEVSGMRRAYMDSKCKNRPVLYRNANELRHGIDRKYFEAYESVSAINRQRCILGLCEIFQEDGYTWSGTMMMQTLGELGRPIAGFSNQDYMVYWPRQKFHEIGNFEPLDLWELASGELTIDDETRAEVHQFFSRNESPLQSRFI